MMKIKYKKTNAHMLYVHKFKGTTVKTHLHTSAAPYYHVWQQPDQKQRQDRLRIDYRFSNAIENLTQ